jgi:hypothetical protein
MSRRFSFQSIAECSFVPGHALNEWLGIGLPKCTASA